MRTPPETHYACRAKARLTISQAPHNAPELETDDGAGQFPEFKALPLRKHGFNARLQPWKPSYATRNPAGKLWKDSLNKQKTNGKTPPLSLPQIPGETFLPGLSAPPEKPARKPTRYAKASGFTARSESECLLSPV
jgi:hypothetical protein